MTLQESKALLAELKGTNISLSAHTADSLSSISQIDSSIANDFRALERKYAAVNTELMSLKAQGSLPVKPSEESESALQLGKCKQQLAHYESAAANGINSPPNIISVDHNDMSAVRMQYIQHIYCMPDVYIIITLKQIIIIVNNEYNNRN